MAGIIHPADPEIRDSEYGSFSSDFQRERSDSSIERSREVRISSVVPVYEVPDEPEGVCLSCSTLWAYLGPASVVIITFLDPGSFEADMQAGSYTGYTLLWVLVMVTGMTMFLQSLALRVGVVTGKTLAQLCRQEYPRLVVVVPLWVGAQVGVLMQGGQEVVASALALGVLLNLPLWAGCLLAGLNSVAFVCLTHRGLHYFERVMVVLLLLTGACFFVSCVGTDLSPELVKGAMQGLVPSLRACAVMRAVGLLGASITPHSIHLQSFTPLTLDIDHEDPRKVREANKYLSLGFFFTLALGFLANVSLISHFASSFFDPDCAEASDICLMEQLAGEGFEEHCLMSSKLCQEVDGSAGLGSLLWSAGTGTAVRYTWAVAVLISSQASTITGAYSSKVILNGFLGVSLSRGACVLITRILATLGVLGLLLYNGGIPWWSEESSMSLVVVTDSILVMGNLVQVALLPLTLLPLLHVMNNREVMGRFVAHGFTLLLGWACTLLVLAAGVGTVLEIYNTQASNSIVWHDGVIAMATVGAFCYIALVVSLSLMALGIGFSRPHLRTKGSAAVISRAFRDELNDDDL